MKRRHANIRILEMNWVTTVKVFNGPPGYCDSDCEQFFTEDYPTKKQLEEFDNEACRKFFHVRNSYVQVDRVSKEKDGAANCDENTAHETSKAALQSEQP